MKREVKTVRDEQLSRECLVCHQPFTKGQKYYHLGMRGAVHIFHNVDTEMPIVFPESIFGEANLLGTQAFARAPWKRQQFLYLAILEDAVLNAFRYQFPQTKREQNLEKEVMTWITDKDNSHWMCSFINCCHVIHIDPDYLRKGILEHRERRRIAVLNSPNGTPAKIHISSSRRFSPDPRPN